MTFTTVYCCNFCIVVVLFRAFFWCTFTCFPILCHNTLSSVAKELWTSCERQDVSCMKHFLSVCVCACLDALAACNYLPQSREKIIAALFKALNSTNSELQEAGEACMRKVSALTTLIFFYFPFSASLPAILPLMSSAWNNQYRMEWGRRWGKWMWLWCIILLWKTGLGFIRLAFPLLMEIHWALSFSAPLLTGDWKAACCFCAAWCSCGKKKTAG